MLRDRFRFRTRVIVEHVGLLRALYIGTALGVAAAVLRLNRRIALHPIPTSIDRLIYDMSVSTQVIDCTFFDGPNEACNVPYLPS